MKPFKRFIIVFFIIFFLIPPKSFCQKTELKDSLKTKLTNTAREIITSAGTCTLITLDDEGRPRAREMDAFLPESDFTIWFGTNPKSRKVNQIKKDPRVTLYYLDSDRSGYVMIYGEAHIINDRNEKAKRWKEEWANFYPDREKGFVLIKFIPEWAEVVSNKYGISGDPITWKPDKVYFSK